MKYKVGDKKEDALARIDYWIECVSYAFDAVGIRASKNQIERVAGAVKDGHETYDMAFATPCNESPTVKNKKKILSKCKKCNGNGYIIIRGLSHNFESDCVDCSGNGFIS